MSIEPGQNLPVQARPLSFAQEQLWFLDQLTPGETIYNILLVWRLRGPLQLDLLRRCLNLVVARHDSLRITIGSADGTPYQVVAPAGEVPLPVTDLRGLPEAELSRRVEAEIEAQRAQPYDLETGPLCRFRLLRLADEEYVFFQDFHHTVTDGWSTAVLNGELSTAYRSLYSGTEPVFEDRELDYTEFAASQRARLQGEALDEELAFWQQRLTDLPVLELPTDRPRPASGGHRGQTLLRDFPSDLRGIAQQLADSHNASLFMVFTAACNLVLSRYSGLEDIPTGIPMLGRPDPELEPLVGMFINMVVLRTDLSGDPTFGELIDRVADASMELYEHQEVSFNQVVDAVQPVRNPDRNPLFGVSIQLLGASNSGENLSFPEVATEFVPLASLGSRFDLGITIVDAGSSLRAAVEYSCDLFDDWRIEALLGHLEAVLRAAAARPELRLSQLPLVAGAEADQLLAAGHGDPAGNRQRLPDAVAELARRQSDQQLYVVDRGLHLVPRGVPGELLIALDPGVSASTHDRSDGIGGMIADDPFRPGRLVLHSGLRARWSADLRLELLDQQRESSEPATEPGRAGAGAGAGDSELRTPTEHSVAGIFGDVLGRPGVGAEESFFDIGGNSLQAMRAVSRINKGFGIKISVRTLYGNVTVRAVSAAVDEKVGGKPA